MAPRIATYLSIFLSLWSLVAAESIPKTDYDVIVVGGGPAGLSALSGVSRVRRTALLFDNQEYRNGPTRNMHDVIGNDGTPPAEFRALAREQILKYPTAHIKNATVKSITPIGTNEVSVFSVVDASGKNYTARKIVLGTGMRDVLPDTPGLQEAWGKGIFWCPWCDGYEHRDQSFGILGNLSDVLGSVLEVNTQFSDIIAFVNGTQTPAGEAQATASHEDWREQLKAWNIKIENRTIASIERLQDGETHQNKTTDMQFDKFLVHFTTGEPVERNAFITNFAAVQRSSLPYQMHLNVTKEKINVDASGMRTNVTGVYAVGDANSDGSTNVPHAMFTGKKAAVYLHVQMSREDSASKISKRVGLSQRELEKEATRAIGRNLEPQWEKIQKRN
ncbi:sulphydryl oxidase [Penicillium brasilianum]|uniref:Sulphydryl oxidase n=1 Tax=Penicillium brasilianum TaxID=104259 RepID=A0A1S9RZ78_PENBI|nr:sulphydryl oxidase [Penicillium brasilianum]